MEESELLTSPLCRAITRDGHTVNVEIYRSEESGWILEVVDEHRNSTVWNDRFDSDQEALDEVNRTILEEGIDVLVGPACSIEV